MIFAADTGQWVVGGGFGLMAIVGLIRFLLGDRGATGILEREINGLSEALKKEREDRRIDISALTTQIASLQAEIRDQRSEKHRLNNELGQSQMLLGVIVELAERCTCGALEVVKDLMARVPTPFNPHPEEP